MEDKTTKQVWDLIVRLSPFSSNVYNDIVVLLFIKYIAKYPDEFLHYMHDANSLKALLEFSRKYDAARSGNNHLTKEDLDLILHETDKCLSNVDSDVRLHDIVEHIPYFFDQRTQSMIIDCLDSIEIDNNTESWNNLLDYISTVSQPMMGKLSDEGNTPSSIRNVAYKLLNVSDDDTLLNCCCGCSSLLLSNIKPFKYIGYDTNRKVTSTSLITATLLKVNSEIYNKDFLYADTYQIADKVFVDAPIGLKRDIPALREKYQINTKDVDVLSIYKAIESTKDDGIAVCVVPGKILFSQSKTGENLRNKLLDNGLKAVILLPALWSSTVINTNIILIDKSYNDDVMFVKADNLGYKDKRSTSLSEEDIEKIIQATSNEIEGMSLLVNKQRIAKEATLMPTAYITNTSRKIGRSVNEIEKELNNLYTELYKNIELLDKQRK